MSFNLKILLFIATLLSVFSLNAQNSSAVPSVKWGKVEKGKKGFSQFYKFLGIQSDKYYFVHKPESDNILLEYDMNHNLLNEQEFDFIKNKERLKIHGAIQTRSGSYIYSHQVSRKYKEWILHTSEFNNGKFTKPKEAYFQELDVSKSRLNSSYKKFQYDQGVVDGGLIISEDSTKVAFINILKRENFNKDDVIAVAVMDDKLNILWKDVFYFKIGERDFEIQQQVVTNEGEVYLVSKEPRPNELNGKLKSMKSKNLPRHLLKIYNINEEGVLDYIIDTAPNTAPVDARLFFTNDDTENFILLGFYTDNEHRNRVKGMYFSGGNNSFEMNDYKLHPFEPHFLQGLVSDRAIKKDKGLEANFDIKDMIEFADGTMGFVAEENYERINYYNDNYYGGYSNFNRFGSVRNNSRREIIYSSNSIILPRFDIYGDLINLQRIDKDYSSSLYNTVSYSIAKKDDKTYLVFNDYKSRSERKSIDKKGRRFTDLVILNGIGDIESRETIFSDREIDLEFSSELSDYNDKYFLIGSTRGTNYCMGVLSIN